MHLIHFKFEFKRTYIKSINFPINLLENIENILLYNIKFCFLISELRKEIIMIRPIFSDHYVFHLDSAVSQIERTRSVYNIMINYCSILNESTMKRTCKSISCLILINIYMYLHDLIIIRFKNNSMDNIGKKDGRHIRARVRELRLVNLTLLPTSDR